MQMDPWTQPGSAPGRLVRALAHGAPVLLLVSSAGCRGQDHHGFRIIAPAFDSSRVRFTKYEYAAVGAYAAEHGELIPFVDANGDGVFDPQNEASGRCDPRSRQCRLDHARLRMIRTTTDCPATTGTWLLGNVYDHEGRRLTAALCDSQGTCSEDHADAFKGTPAVDAIWIPESSATSRPRTLTLRTATEKFRHDDIVLPSPLHLVDIQTKRAGDLYVRATADQSIDLAALWVMRGQSQRWSSAEGPSTLKARGAVLEARVPGAILDSCHGACEVYLQFGHVWLDGDVLSLGEVKHKLP